MVAPADWLNDFRDRLGSGRIAFVCGTGVSMALAAPNDVATWKGLLHHGVRHLAAIDARLEVEAGLMTQMLGQAEPTTTTFISVADWIRNQFEGSSEGEFRAWLKNTVGALTLSESAPGYLATSELPILTSNYDGLLEELTGRRAIEWTDVGHIAQYFDEPGQFVYHVHGHWDNPDSVVLSASDYQRLSLAPTVSRAFETLSGNYTFAFLGYGAGMNDPNYKRFLAWFKDNFAKTGRAAYALCRTSDRPEKLTDANGLRYLPYGDNYDDLWEFLAALAPAQPPPASDATTNKLQADAASEGELLELLPAHVREEVALQLGNPVSWNGFQRDVLRRERSLVTEGGASLVAAVTGTGKTTLSRAAMNLSVALGTAAVMLVPTKALVAQEVREWDRWLQAWYEDGKQIRVYPASRDYPESDAPVSRGRFNVAIAIYEKLAGYLVGGQPSLDKTSLLVVDEMQTLVDDDERARKLEALLTMVHLLPPERQPAIVGLSATLSRRSTDALRSWLEIPPDAFISSVDRPVPLDTYVLDSKRIRKQANSHLVALGDEGVTLPEAEEEDHHLEASQSAMRLNLNGLHNAPIGIALIVKLLKEDPSRRIIAFVPGRTAAEEVALSVQRELDGAIGLVQRSGNPWESGRFAGSVDPSVALMRYEALRHSDLPMFDHVLRGLRTGVAYHTARLPAQLRRMLEDEFRDPEGALRVLIATDTLAQGVNLPADAVVSFSIAMYGRSRTPVLSTAAQLDNKAGRAGRRGLAARERGEFYIVVPTEGDLQDVTNLTKTGIKALSTVGGVFDHYVTGSSRTPDVVGRIRSLDEVALLSLQVLCSDGFGRSNERLEARVATIISSLLAAQEAGAELPSASSVISRLRELKLLSPATDSKTTPTRLGFALGRSALSLPSAYVLEHLGRLAIAGAGDIDILFNAFRSPEVEEVSAWVGMPAVEARHKPSMKEKLTTYAMAYCAEGLQQRQYCAQFFGQDRHALVADWVVEGQPVRSSELSDLLTRDVEQIEDREATALLRALVAFEWSRGVPFDEMKARFSSAITSDEDQRGKRPVEIKIHYSDVEQLCEQVAGVIRGAAAVSFSESHDWSVRIGSLALRVEVGLPSWLAPIARLRAPLLHRNRLARLWRASPDHNHLSEVLDMPELREAPGITDSQREELRNLLDQREYEDTLFRHRVAQAWAGGVVPGLEGITFEEFSEELGLATTAQEYAARLAQLAAAMGIQSATIAATESYVTVQWEAGGERVSLALPAGELGRDEIEAVMEDDVLVLLRTRLRPSAMAVLTQRPTAARFVRPEVLLEVFAKLSEARGAALDPAEAIERLRQLRVSILNAEDVTLTVDAPAGPPPFVGKPPAFPDSRPIEAVSESDAD